MDEPLSNLDAQLRMQMRVEIKRLQRELGVTTLYVTHDQIEAMTMADLIAVMRDGRLQQLATPAELYARPANLFVARFCGSPPMNVLAGEIADGAFRHPAGDVRAAGRPARGPATLGFRPEHAELAAPTGSPARSTSSSRWATRRSSPSGAATTLINVRAARGLRAAGGRALRAAPGRTARAPVRPGVRGGAGARRRGRPHRRRSRAGAGVTKQERA